MNRNVCCFFGHRKIEESTRLKQNLRDTVCRLIAEECVDTFLFGSKSEFDDLCHEVVSELKGEFPFLKRVYVRAEFPHIDKAILRIYCDSMKRPIFHRRSSGRGAQSMSSGILR